MKAVQRKGMLFTRQGESPMDHATETSRLGQEEADQAAMIQIVSAIYRREKTTTSDHGGGTSTIPNQRLSTDTFQERKLKLSFSHPLRDGYTRIICNKQLRVLGYQKPEQRIFSAVAWENPYLIEELVLQGLSVNVRDANGVTPLHIAASHDQAQCLQVLLNLGADVNAVAMTDITPMYLATAAKATKCMELLTAAGGSYRAPKPPVPGHRSVLDAVIPQVTTAADIKASRTMGRKHAYYGQY